MIATTKCPELKNKTKGNTLWALVIISKTQQTSSTNSLGMINDIEV